MSTSPAKPAPTRVVTPTLLQMEVVECGAAALGIVLGYYGRTVSLEELRVACGVSRDGTKAGNILKAARAYGLVGKAYSRQPSELAKYSLPQIVFWNFNHFLVVEGFGPDKVYLNDPASGPRAISQAEFDSSFTGVVLVLEKGPDFKPGGRKPGLIGPLRERLRGSGAGLLYIILVSLVLTLIGLLVPLFGKVFVDYCLAGGRSDWVAPLLAGMGMTAALRFGLTWVQRHHLLRLETKLSLSSSYQFFRHVLRLPIEFFQQRSPGEVGNRVAINDRIAKLLSRDLAANLLNGVMVVAYAALMLYFDVLLTGIAIGVAVLNLVALRWVSRYRRNLNAWLLQEQAKLTAAGMSGLQSIETVKASGAEQDLFARIAGQLAKVMVAQQRMQLSTRLLDSVPILLSTLNSVAILGVGALRVMDGTLTAGMLVAFQAAVAGFLEPFNQLVGLGSSIQEIDGEINRLDDVLRYPADPSVTECPPLEPTTLPRLAGGIELDNLTYGYSRLDPPLLTGLSLSVRPGARVALVGPSGSGKSTVARLLCGLYRPWSGDLRFDGVPAEKIPREVLTNSIALVDQDFFLFEGTVRDVITMWDPTIPEEVVVRGAKDASIHAEIAARPAGYDSKVEEGGANFSGGQRQRLEIARALAATPSILILDEATSALDPVTEKLIDDNLRRRGCTCVIVAHRLSTIRDCDEIIVLDKGRVVQRGTHEQLMATPGHYRKLVEV